MQLCLDVGNTHIDMGLFDGNQQIKAHRYPSKKGFSPSAFTAFLRGFLSSNTVEAACFCSVVPDINGAIIEACERVMTITPVEINHQFDTGIALAVDHPTEVGMDRVVNAVAAVSLYPNRPLVIVDFGTATTVCAVSKSAAFLGGAILPGMQLSMEALAMHAAQLPEVPLEKPVAALGKNTQTNIQSGLYYSQLGAISLLVKEFADTTFAGEEVTVIATGGAASLFADSSVFDHRHSGLVLMGLRILVERCL